jgi:hypothetical protein
MVNAAIFAIAIAIPKDLNAEWVSIILQKLKNRQLSFRAKNWTKSPEFILVPTLKQLPFTRAVG